MGASWARNHSDATASQWSDYYMKYFILLIFGGIISQTWWILWEYSVSRFSMTNYYSCRTGKEKKTPLGTPYSPLLNRAMETCVPLVVPLVQYLRWSAIALPVDIVVIPRRFIISLNRVLTIWNRNFTFIFIAVEMFNLKLKVSYHLEVEYLIWVGKLSSDNLELFTQENMALHQES